ncbi:hypothetical protein ElyMa_005803500 [Elysia marginata]|uniref:Uncharacterized protein n=1 Tax=Elysia marginata TaxID=1093978 RepID=A0AAV4FTF9_9GAST|nr:hypothetical protein ElyMa_005803500 [Elysia marginata]
MPEPKLLYVNQDCCGKSHTEARNLFPKWKYLVVRLDIGTSCGAWLLVCRVSRTRGTRPSCVNCVRQFSSGTRATSNDCRKPRPKRFSLAALDSQWNSPPR